MRLRKRFVASTTAVALLLLSGCDISVGGDGGAPPGGDNSDLGNADVRTDPGRQGPVAVAGATTGGTVTVLSAAGLGTLDPSTADDPAALSILRGLVTRSLTQLVPTPKGDGAVLVPDLATDLGTPNKDFTVWEFTLRDGISYENGDPVTAADVAFGIRRAAASTDVVDSVTVRGRTLTLTLAEPFPDLAYWGTLPSIGPIPDRSASDLAGYGRRPLATGPYKLEDYVPGKSLTLVRNDEWDPATDPGRTAYPDAYEFDFDTAPDRIDRIMLADEGDGQTTMTYDNVQNEGYREFAVEQADRLVLGGQPLTEYWAPDNRKITDIRVRRALAWAYPYEDALLAGGYIPDVTRVLGTALLPPGAAGRQDYNPLKGHQAGETDPEKARSLLRAAGKVGYPIRFPFETDDPDSVNVKRVTSAALEEAGFTPVPVPTTVRGSAELQADPDAALNVRIGRQTSDWPTAGAWVPPLYESTDLRADGLGSNYAAFDEPSVDKRVAAIRRLPVQQQSAAFGALDEEVNTTYFPVFVTGYGGVAMMHGSRINGFSDDLASGMPTWKTIWVAD